MLRDKFAMAAMQGLLSDRNNLASSYPEETAQKAYRQADAMMKERANWDFSKDPEAVTVVYNNNHIHHGVDAPGKSTGVPGEWQPDWSQAPNGTTGWSMMESGLARWHLHHGAGVLYAPSFGYQGDWRESLRKRPTK